VTRWSLPMAGLLTATLLMLPARPGAAAPEAARAGASQGRPAATASRAPKASPYAAANRRRAQAAATAPGGRRGHSHAPRKASHSGSASK